MPRALVNGITIDHEVHGDGEQALLFVSGTGVTRHPWLPFQVPFFKQHYRVIVYDHRGRLIPAGAHAYYWQKADEFNAAVFDFLRRH